MNKLSALFPLILFGCLIFCNPLFSQISNQSDSLYQEEFFQTIINRLDYIIAIFGGLMTLITVIFGVIIAWNNHRQFDSFKELLEKERNQIKEYSAQQFQFLEERFNIDKIVNNFKSEAEVAIKTIPEKIRSELHDSFYKQSDVRQLIYETTKTFTSEALQLSATANEVSFSRMRSFSDCIMNVFHGTIPSEKESLLNDCIEHYVTDWLTIRRIMSLEKNQIISGLDDFIMVHQVSELKRYLLEVLLPKYKDDPEIELRIKKALDKLAYYQSGSVKS